MQTSCPDSVFFQQAAYLTAGSYIYLEHREALLQYLIVRSLSYVSFVQLTTVFQMSFSPTPCIRKIITVPMEDKTDFRAACFGHKRVVDVGYACLVCLSGLVHPIARPRTPADFLYQGLLPTCTRLPKLPVSPPSLLPSSYQHVATRLSTKFPMKTLQRLNMTRTHSRPSTHRLVNGALAKQVFTGFAANLR